MPETSRQPNPVKNPYAALASRAGGVLAIITGVEGPSYRPVGATMAVFPGRGRVGTLSSGCIESDIELHAAEVLKNGAPRQIRYGRNSPFVDIRLPCGGGLDILLVPEPNRTVLANLCREQAARRPATLRINPATGDMNLGEPRKSETTKSAFFVRLLPDIRFLVFGKGPEASTFSGLVQASGFPNLLISPDQETLDFAARSGSETRHINGPVWPPELETDPQTAIVLFFHDHEWEPPILKAALQTSAFYIGAQGSRRARDLRMLELEALDVPRTMLKRLRGPIGLVASARDARTLAVSVLAEVLAQDQLKTGT